MCVCVCDEMKRPGQAAWLFSGKDMFLANAAPCRPSVLVVVRSPSSVVRCPYSVVLRYCCSLLCIRLYLYVRLHYILGPVFSCACGCACTCDCACAFRTWIQKPFLAISRKAATSNSGDTAAVFFVAVVVIMVNGRLRWPDTIGK